MQEIDTEELKQKAPIVDYVKRFYNDKIKIVEETSTTAKANCIWHEDNETPSLTFWKNTNTYKCFGCGKHGDLIILVQTLENVDFQHACKIIGDNVGYEVILEPPNIYFEQYKDTMDNLSRRYWYNYQMSDEAQKYMSKRGIQKETLDYYRIGLTAKDEYKYRKIGCISNRISFPILEPKRNNAKCIGMGYRIFDNQGIKSEIINPKYINDTNQDGGPGKDKNLAGIFIKGNCLFGYAQAYDAIKSMNSVFLVEGYMDVLSLYQSGIKNVVASMGTALTENQIILIKKLTNNIILFLDSDKAGISSMEKVLPLLFKYNFNVKICLIDAGKDPADLCLENSMNKSKITEIIVNNTKDAINFIIDKEVSKYESYVITQRKKILELLEPILISLNPVDRKLMQDLLYKRLDIK